MSLKDSQALFNELQGEYLEEDLGLKIEGEAYKFFQRTVKGNSLSNARVRPIKRTTANLMLAKLLERVISINNDPKMAFTFPRLIAFGSYMKPEVLLLGDLDIAYEMTDRFQSGAKQQELEKQVFKEAALNGRVFPNITKELFWPQDQCLYALKARTPQLSLHSMTRDEHIVLSGPHKVVFGPELPKGI